MSEVKRFFLLKHNAHYKVYNLCSERSYSPKHFLNATASFPFDDHNPCPFYLLIQFCEDAKTYLDQNPKNVIAVHCKAGKGRTGLVLCCYLLFSKEQPNPDAALAFYAEARTKDRKGVTIPSQIRWVRRFGEYLQKYRWANPPRPFSANGTPIVITSIEIHGYPYGIDPVSVSPCVRISLMKNKTLVWDSKVNGLWKSATGEVPKWIKGDTRPYIIACEVQVTGDFHITCTNNEQGKVFGLWDHSTFVCGDEKEETRSVYQKATLDGPSKDCKKHVKFPKDFQVVVCCRKLRDSEVITEESESDEKGPVDRKTIRQVNNPIKKLVSKKKLRYQKDGFDLDLSYITPTIIAMGFPSAALEGMYRNKMSDVQRFLKYYHDGHFKVYNLCSERTYTPDNFGNSTASYPFDDHNPCPFKTLVKFCEDASEYHKRDPANCTVIHCKAGKGRTGLVISALLLAEGQAKDAATALEQYGAARTSNVKGVTIPSQRRYVYYYHEYLTNYQSMGRPFTFAGPIIRLIGFHMQSYPKVNDAGCTPNFKVSLMDKTIIYNHKVAVGGKLLKWTKEMPAWSTDCDIELQGDVHVVFYDNNNKMFGFWMHTAFIHSASIVLEKDEIDGAANDKKHSIYPKDFKCQIFFADVQEDDDQVATLSPSSPNYRSRTRTHTIGAGVKPAPISQPPDAFLHPEDDDEDDDQEGGYSSPSDKELSEDEYLEEETKQDHQKSQQVIELEAQLTVAIKEQQWDKCCKIRDSITKLKCNCGGYFENNVCLTCNARAGGGGGGSAAKSFRGAPRAKSPSPANASQVLAPPARASEPRPSNRDKSPARSLSPDPSKLEHKVAPKPPVIKVDADTTPRESGECVFVPQKGTVWAGMPCATCGVPFKQHPNPRSPSASQSVRATSPAAVKYR